MLDFLRTRSLDGESVLEIGGGVGALQIELLRSGASGAVNVELSPEWEDSAASLVRERGLEARVERRIGDAVAEAATLQPADIVVMDRVVCCYHDPDALVGVAADRARRSLVLSFPHERWLNRLVVSIANVWCRARRIDFRSYVHPERAIEQAAERSGLRLVFDRPGWWWRVVAFEPSRE